MSKDYSEFLGPKHKNKSVLAKQKFICFGKSHLSVGPVHPYWRETISRLHTEKLSRNQQLQENMESCQNLFLVHPQYCPPFSPTIQCLPEIGGRKVLLCRGKTPHR